MKTRIEVLTQKTVDEIPATMQVKTFNEIKRELINAWLDWGMENEDFSLDSTGLEFAKKQIKRLNKRSIDLIDLRDAIGIKYEFANKNFRGESFLDFRNSGKAIDAFTLK